MFADVLGMPYSWAAMGVVLVLAAVKLGRMAVGIGIGIVGVLALGHFGVVPLPGLP